MTSFAENEEFETNQNPSICIPRVFKNIQSKDIQRVFCEVIQDANCIERIDSIDKLDRQKKLYQRVFVHFKYWPNNDTAQFIKNKLYTCFNSVI